MVAAAGAASCTKGSERAVAAGFTDTAGAKATAGTWRHIKACMRGVAHRELRMNINTHLESPPGLHLVAEETGQNISTTATL